MFARIAICSLFTLALAAGSAFAQGGHGASSQGLNDMGASAGGQMRANTGGQMASGSNGSQQMTPQPTGNFNASNYKSGADCLNAATLAHAPLSACGHLK